MTLIPAVIKRTKWMVWGSFQCFTQTGNIDNECFKVLASASHYWPLDSVEGIDELRDPIGDRAAFRIHNFTVLPSCQSSSVCANDSAYSNLSATVDIVEGVVNTDIYLSSDSGTTLLLFGSYTNSSCGSDLTLCNTAGITISGFSIHANVYGGYIKFYTHTAIESWRATINSPGPDWTHILFTWSPADGLKVYVNGTFRTSGVYGNATPNYGENLVTSSESGQSYGQQVSGSFDEFVIWERVLSAQDIALYYQATTGRLSWQLPHSSIVVVVCAPQVSTAASPAPGTHRQEESRKLQHQGPSFSFLESFSVNLPQKTLELPIASNLTEVNVASDRSLSHIQPLFTHNNNNNSCIRYNAVSRLLVVSKHYSLVKVPSGVSLNKYRFPTHGKNYISIPGEAFHTKCKCLTHVFLLLFTIIHKNYGNFQSSFYTIKEATPHKDLQMTVTSYIISLKMEPGPSLSQNLSGSPLITIVLKHVMTQEQYSYAVNISNQAHLWCAFLDFSSGAAVWSNEGCARIGGNISYSVCLCNHLTNFAILMQVVPLQMGRGHQVALSAITYVGCSISIVCLCVTLITFAILSSVSTIRNQRYHIHGNLAFAILVAQLLLLVSFRFYPGTLPCTTLAILLHFFFLSAFSWMLVEGLHLYSMVVKVFGSEESKHLCYYGIGWGDCWLSLERGAIWAFVAPALFVILVNIGILIAVTRIISRISSDNYKMHGDANAFKLTAKAVAVLLPILGISWAFGVLAINKHTLIFQYMFALFNSLQGFFIFLFHCLLNSEVRAAFKHKTKVWTLNSSSIRNANVKPFNSDIVNGDRAGSTPTKLNSWEKSTNSANPMGLSAV
uniref:Adhesion G protein-coupled receptor D1 n=1 Tax=Callorhinchus milii TaxID=7868 RepID=A0A4W3IZV1_CALMI